MKSKYFIFGFFVTIVFFACTKEGGSNSENPYSKIKPKVTPLDTSKPIDPNTIQGIYANVFSPVCANSGCHDGTFEPDFRSIESSYSTLVQRIVIKKDTAKKFTFRVMPGNADLSMLMHRLTEDLNGNSGIMPLVIEPGTDWAVNKDKYIQNIKNWINNGAKDAFGKNPQNGDLPPQVVGFAAFSGGNPLTRSGKYEPILVTAGTGNVDLWFSFADDKTAQGSLTANALNFTIDPIDFSTNGKSPLTLSTPKILKSLYGDDVQYMYKYTINLSSYKKDDVIWLRVYTSDGVNGTTQLPGALSVFSIKKYLAIKII